MSPFGGSPFYFFREINMALYENERSVFNMMTFISMTISFTVAILLSAVLGFIIITRPTVMKWYIKYVVKTMSKMEEVMEESLTSSES